jgi:hypothetical protein
LIACVEEVRVARESARHEAASVSDRRVAELRAAVVRAREAAKEAEARAARLADRLDRIPPWRRGERALVRSDGERARRDLERHRHDARVAEGELASREPHRVAGREGAKRRAAELSAELASLEARLDVWARSAERAGRPGLRMGHHRSPEARDLGRGR